MNGPLGKHLSDDDNIDLKIGEVGRVDLIQTCLN